METIAGGEWGLLHSLVIPKILTYVLIQLKFDQGHTP